MFGLPQDQERNLFSNSEDADQPACPCSVVGTFAGHLFAYFEYTYCYDGRRSEYFTRMYRGVGFSEFALGSSCLCKTGVLIAQ